MAVTREWTLMFYFASDNPLAPGIVSQLKAIKDAGYHPEANVIARFDPHVPNAPAHIFDVNLVNKFRAGGASQVGFTHNDPFIRSLVLDKLWDDSQSGIRKRIKASLGKEESGEFDPPAPPPELSGEQNPRDSLSSFLRFCLDKYPARHYMLFILGHGVVVGNDVFLFDEHPSNQPQIAFNPGTPTPGAMPRGWTDMPDFPPANTLLLTDLGKVLQEFKELMLIQNPKAEFEFIGFHSCSMSGLEVAYQLRGTANYMMASQGPAFVGSWPYRAILIRIFNDLNATEFKLDDLVDAGGFIVRLKESKDRVSTLLRSRLNSASLKLLDEHDPQQSPAPELLTEVVKALNNLIRDPQLQQVMPQIMPPKLLPPDSTGRDESRKPSSEKECQKRLSRAFIADTYSQEIGRINVKKMLTRIFYYCLYNSHDFQLAGYPFDIALCDLKKVPSLTESIEELASALIASLAVGADPLAEELILLAHWDAQSYWQENYTDLYDFCFCLDLRCRHVSRELLTSSKIRDRIQKACQGVMDMLERGTEGADDKIIVRSAFAGPAFQYSHGLSVYFPWSEPSDGFFKVQYRRYTFEETMWSEFLREYFKQTMRRTHRWEISDDPREQRAMQRAASRRDGKAPHETSILEGKLLEVLEQMTGQIISESSQQLKAGPKDTTGPKTGTHDPTGDDGSCPSIKNYPPFTQISEGFFEGFFEKRNRSS